MPHTLENSPWQKARAISPAGRQARAEGTADRCGALEEEYYERKPDVADRNQLVAFGTSGHRGSALHGTFNEAHILAITQAICDYRKGRPSTGLSIWGRIPMRFLRPPSALPSKCWRRMALRPSFRKTTA